jgi:hypothetical protein
VVCYAANINHYPMQTESTFTQASKLVKEIETKVICKTAFPRPAKFLLMGICETIKQALVPLILLCLITLGLYLVDSSFLAILAPELPLVNVIVSVASLALLLLCVFGIFTTAAPLPSTYGDSGVKVNDVADVVTHLQSFKTEKEIELLKKSVKLFEDQTRARLTALKWVVNLIFGGSLGSLGYTVTKGAELKADNLQLYNLIVSAIPQIALILFLSYLCVWGYEAALDRLFRTIEFGCNDFCQDVETPKQIEALEL